jgi:hypothetical protein
LVKKGKPDTIEVRAVAFSHLIQSRPLDWEPPMRSLLREPENADFVWRRLQYVFRLPDPTAFPEHRLVLGGDETEMCRRFVEHAESIAGTSLMSAEDTVTISLPDEGAGEAVEADFSAHDVTVGFMTLFRQFYADDEEASFSRVRKVISQRLHDAGHDEDVGVVKQWQKANARLRRQTLEEWVQEEMITDGQMPGTSVGPDGKEHSMVVRAPDSPDQLLRQRWYGGDIHWGRYRTQVTALEADPFMAALADITARSAAVDLTHLYLGFAVVVRRAINL